jgi:hypothetical protein
MILKCKEVQVCDMSWLNFLDMKRKSAADIVYFYCEVKTIWKKVFTEKLSRFAIVVKEMCHFAENHIERAADFSWYDNLESIL